MILNAFISCNFVNAQGNVNESENYIEYRVLNNSVDLNIGTESFTSEKFMITTGNILVHLV